MSKNIYSNIENRVLGARSEISDFAVIQCHGVPNGNHHPSGVKSKPGPLSQDSLLIASLMTWIRQWTLTSDD